MANASPLNQYRQLIETGLRTHLPLGGPRCSPALNAAIEYAIFPGGKRLRPALALLSAEAAGGTARQALPAACAIEYLHTSSLIVDDLPAMDDADLRRGRLSLHLRFGEDIALLAALALLNRAYAIFGSRPALIAEAASCIGERGMIGGQSVDLQEKATDFERRNQKTTALMRLTLTAGALASNADSVAVSTLAHVGSVLGEAYQIYDDMLDAFSPREATGKTAGQDERHHRPTHVEAREQGSCTEQVQRLLDHAKAKLLHTFGATPAVCALNAAIDALVPALPAVPAIVRSAGASLTATARP